MLGCRNGVVTQLKRIRPSAIGVHCAAYVYLDGPVEPCYYSAVEMVTTRN